MIIIKLLIQVFRQNRLLIDLVDFKNELVDFGGLLKIQKSI